MINYKYNELAYAEIISEKGFQTKYIPTELRLLTLYYRDVLKLKPKVREEKIYEFCNDYITDFKKEKYFKTINKALNTGLKKETKLIVISEIEIYTNELNYINSLDIKYEYKKVIFAFLVQCKLNKIVCEYKYEKDYDSVNIYFKGGNKKYNDIKKMANIPVKMSINDEVINELSKLELITILHKGTIILECVKNCIEDGGVAITITDYENVGLYLDFYNGVKGVKKCEKCDIPIKVIKNNQKYCKICSEIVDREKARNRMSNIRMSN